MAQISLTKKAPTRLQTTRSAALFTKTIDVEINVTVFSHVRPMPNRAFG